MSAASAQVTITVQVTGKKAATYLFPTAPNPVPPQNTNSPASDFNYTLPANVAQAIAVPANAQYVLLVPQGAGNLSLTTAAAIVAVPIDNNNPSIIALRAGTTVIYIESDTLTTIEGCFF